MAYFPVATSFFSVDGVQLSVDENGKTMVTNVGVTRSGDAPAGLTYFGIAPETRPGAVKNIKMEVSVDYYLSSTQLEIAPSNTTRTFVMLIPGGRYLAFRGVIYENSPTFDVSADACNAKMSISADPTSITYSLAPSGSYS